MTEDEWGTAANPYHMLLHVRRNGPGLRSVAGRRKFRLFGCASVRRVWDSLTHPELRTAVELVEQFADGGIDGARLEWVQSEIRHNFAKYPRELRPVFSCLIEHETWTATRAWQWTCKPGMNGLRGNKPVAEKVHLARLVRCVFGNPFRTVPFDPVWRTSDTVALARGIYNDHAFDRLPILADALQDAGCNNDDVLTHCREAGTPHARGCWVVDQVLGFS